MRENDGTLFVRLGEHGFVNLYLMILPSLHPMVMMVFVSLIEVHHVLDVHYYH